MVRSENKTQSLTANLRTSPLMTDVRIASRKGREVRGEPMSEVEIVGGTDLRVVSQILTAYRPKLLP